MELQKKHLKALRRVRTRERLSMSMLFTMLGVFREVHAPWIPADDIDGTASWFLDLNEKSQTQLIDDAMGVGEARRMGAIK